MFFEYVLSKVFVYVLLPFVKKIKNNSQNQLLFKRRINCPHAHRVLTCLSHLVYASGSEVHFCSLDLSNAFDSVSHAQVMFSLVSSEFNISFVRVLQFWDSNSQPWLEFSLNFYGNISIRS